MQFHTPGPWKATTLHGESTKEPFLIWSDKLEAAVAQVFNRSEAASDNHAIQRANARLIAAAPDLLDICERVLMEINGLSATMRSTSNEYKNSELCKRLSELVKDSAEAVHKARNP